MENQTTRHSLRHFCLVSTSGVPQESQQFNRLSRETLAWKLNASNILCPGITQGQLVVLFYFIIINFFQLVRWVTVRSAVMDIPSPPDGKQNATVLSFQCLVLR